MEIKNGGIMMRIITISREFGSGGRELGKRLADALGIPCYDHEIMDMVAEKYGFDKNYISHVSEKDIRVFYPTTIAHRLIAPHLMTQQSVSIAVSEHQLIQELAQQGDCVIVGRSADIVFREMLTSIGTVLAAIQLGLPIGINKDVHGIHFS